MDKLIVLIMLPPICELCDKDFRQELETDPTSGGLVYFSDLKSIDNGMSGHPHGAAWFCRDHLKDAQFLASLPMAMAMQQLKNIHSIK